LISDYEHWSTRHLSEEEVRLRYERIMSRLAGDSFREVVDELRLRLDEALEQGWLDEGLGSDLRVRIHPPR
jgi:hypothetical protein